MGHLPSIRGASRPGHVNAVLCSQAISAARQIDQGDRRAVARLGQAAISNSADGRLIHTRLFGQLSLAETLRFE